MLFPHASSKARGFTLTELAIVLGIIGLILGAIWVAASKVYQNNRAQTAVKELETIVQGYRSLYTTHNVDTGDNVDITCTGVNSGFFPNDMLISTCSAGSTGTYPQHPWNSYVLVQSYQSYQGIRIYFMNLPQNACNQLAQQVVNAPDIVYEDISGAAASTLPPFGAQAPLTTAQVNSSCANSNSNYIDLIFKAR